MSALVALVVLLSAVVHATWNAIAKAIPDRLVASALIGLACLVCGAAGAMVLPVPARAAWPYLITSAVLQAVYLLLLTAAYARSEFGRVYPLARGISPALVAVITVTVLHESLHPAQLVGVAVLAGALCSLVLLYGMPHRGDGLWPAIATGVVIAAYTLVDGVGVRRSGDPFAYAAWLFLLQGPMLLLACRLLAGSGLPGRMRRHARLGLAGGLLSVAAYGAVLWAQSRSNIALVAALRETSVLFAAIIGSIWFGERFGRVKVVAAVGVVAGLVLLNLG